MTRDPNDICQHCPAFAKDFDADGNEILVPVIRGGHPVTQDGKPLHRKDAAGNYVFFGACRLMRPKKDPTNGSIGFPLVPSDWWCCDPARYALIDRLQGSKPRTPRR